MQKGAIYLQFQDMVKIYDFSLPYLEKIIFALNQ